MPAADRPTADPRGARLSLSDDVPQEPHLGLALNPALRVDLIVEGGAQDSLGGANGGGGFGEHRGGEVVDGGATTVVAKPRAKASDASTQRPVTQMSNARA